MTPRVDFAPFCDNVFEKDVFNLGGSCLGCQFFEKAYGINSSLVSEKELKMFCNPNITEYPLPLYKCGVCNPNILHLVLSWIIILSCCTIFINLWALLVWFSVKCKRPQIYFKISLTLSDFLFGALVLPETAYHLLNTMYVGREEYYAFYKITSPNIIDKNAYEKGWEVLFQPSHIHISAAVLYVTQSSSLCSILLLNIDRYIAIAHGLRYKAVMTKKKSLFIIFAMWAFAIILGIITTIKMGKFTITPSALFLLIVEQSSDSENTMVYILLLYLTPLALVFIANVGISALTSYRLTKTNGTNCYSTTLFKASITKEQNEKETLKLTMCLQPTMAGKQVDNFSTNQPSALYRTQNNTKLQKKESKCYVNASPEKKNDNIIPKDNDSTEGLYGSPERGIVVPIQINKLLKKNSSTSCRAMCNSSRTEHKAANRTLILILLIYTACVLPLSLLLVRFLADDSKIYTKDGIDLIAVGFTTTVGIFMTSSLWNCIIYNVRNREFRATGKEIFKKIVKLLPLPTSKITSH